MGRLLRRNAGARSVGDLKSSLKGQGSDLMVRFGRVEKILKELVDKVNTTCVLEEDEAEYSLLNVLAIAKEVLMALPFTERRVDFLNWQKPNALTTSYDAFKKVQKPLIPCQPYPTFHSSTINVAWGDVPTYDKMMEFMDGNPSKLAETWALMRETSAETILRKKLSRPNTSSANVLPLGQTKKIKFTSAFITCSRSFVEGGSCDVLNALAAYLRYYEGAARDGWQEYAINSLVWHSCSS